MSEMQFKSVKEVQGKDSYFWPHRMNNTDIAFLVKPNDFINLKCWKKKMNYFTLSIFYAI